MYKVYKAIPLVAVALLFCFSTAHAQDHHGDDSSSKTPSDIVTFGTGFGLDYGGIGLNLTVYPQRNIGLFGGVGYAFAGAGYNAGIRLRLLPGNGASKVRPFLTAMYGYNAAVYIANDMTYDKIFYGPTVGAGLEIGSMNLKRGYFCIAVLVPIRSPDVNDYIDQMRSAGVSFSNNLLPVAVSLGLKIPFG